MFQREMRKGLLLLMTLYIASMVLLYKLGHIISTI